MQWNTCRFCGTQREWRHGLESKLVKYGVRHWAHLSCLKDRGRLQAWIDQTPAWMLNQLPYFEMQDLGILDCVKDRVAKEGK